MPSMVPQPTGCSPRSRPVRPYASSGRTTASSAERPGRGDHAARRQDLRQRPGGQHADALHPGEPADRDPEGAPAVAPPAPPGRRTGSAGWPTPSRGRTTNSSVSTTANATGARPRGRGHDRPAASRGSRESSDERRHQPLAALGGHQPADDQRAQRDAHRDRGEQHADPGGAQAELAANGTASPSGMIRNRLPTQSRPMIARSRGCRAMNRRPSRGPADRTTASRWRPPGPAGAAAAAPASRPRERT